MNFYNLIQWYGVDEMFKDINLPDTLDWDITVNTIIDKCFYYTPLAYERGLFLPRILNFFNKNYNSYSKLAELYLLDYNPIENYNKVSTITKDVKEETSSNSNSDRGTTTTENVSTYDTSTYKPNTEVKDDIKDINSGNSVTLYSDTLNDVTKGNIGVTTTQQMIESEIALREKLRIYDIIANDFFNEFMLKCL